MPIRKSNDVSIAPAVHGVIASHSTDTDHTIGHPGCRSQNYTIDDSQWSTPALSLTAGWNMLRTNGSNEYINSTQVAQMQSVLGELWNSSVSWTSTEGSATTLTFVGTDIWAYGVSGRDQAEFNVTLNNATLGTYSASASTTDYHHLLFSAHGLDDGVDNELIMTNVDGWLAFDYAVIASTSYFESSTTPSATATTTDTAALASASAAAVASASQAAAAAASSAAAAALYTQYSAAQLAALETVYKFKWNPAAYFVVVFAGIVLASFLVFILHHYFNAFIQNQRRKAHGGPLTLPIQKNGHGEHSQGESWLMSPSPTPTAGSQAGSATSKTSRPRPRTRVLEALKGKNISHPFPSDAGSVNNSKRESDGSGGSLDFGSGQREHDPEQGW